MAFFTPSLSPAVVTREIDLTGIVPNVGTSTGVFVGDFRWGPVQEPIRVDNEARLVSLFASPDTNNTVDFHSAAYFTKYSSELFVIRQIDDTAKNSFDNNGSRSAPTVKNLTHFDEQVTNLDGDSALDPTGHNFIAKYPGVLGNSVQIQICPPSTNDSALSTDSHAGFISWQYGETPIASTLSASGTIQQFDAAPGTSEYARGVGALNDEVHVAIIDKLGNISGTKGAVLETYPYVSLARNAKNADGSSNYIKDVINNGSQFVWIADPANIDSDYRVAGAGQDADSGDNFKLTANATSIKTINLTGGVDVSGNLTTGEYATAFDLIEDVDKYQVDFLIAPPVTETSGDTKAKTIVTDLVEIAGLTRKDCVVVASPPKSAVINNITPVTSTVNFANSLTSSSYLFMDNNYLTVFDKYNDQYIQIPANSSTAGIMAQSDFQTAPWFSPAGQRRGVYFGVVGLAHTPNKAERDSLYRANVNPITNLPGFGLTLFGDKTFLKRPSAFDRINVRRLFLTLERAISRAAQQVLFEFNDEFTRAEFVNIVEPFLREVKGRRGITDFRVVCDETNNTPEIIDRNEFIATIFIKPARSINYITLNFVAVRTGVDFEEVVGLSF